MRQFQLKVTDTRKIKNLRKTDSNYARDIIRDLESERITYFIAQVTNSGFGVFCEKSLQDVINYYRDVYGIKLEQVAQSVLLVNGQKYVVLVALEKHSNNHIIYVFNESIELECIEYITPNYTNTYHKSEFDYRSFLLEFGKAQGRTGLDLAA